MNRIFRPPHLTAYEADYARWCAEQGALLRSGQLDKLDRDNLAEEIESLGRSEKREIESRLTVLVMHLLKWLVQPEKRRKGWAASIAEQRRRLRKTLADNPSLATYPAEELPGCYVDARFETAKETGMDVDSLPDTCPFTIEQVLDPAFSPD